MSPGLSDSQRHTFHELADWFMPTVDGFPSNADADPDDEALDLALDQLKPLMPEINAALDAAAQRGADRYLPDIAESDPETYELLRTLLIGRYLMCRSVWDVLGYTGKKPLPIHQAEFDHDFDDGVLDLAIARGKTYRPTPG